MNTIIGADAAKLAGLQIDALTKFRDGQLSLGHLERFLNLSPDAREDRFGDFKRPVTEAAPVVETPVDLPAEASAQAGKFGLLADLGEITVPANYDHAKHLDSFRKKNKKKFYFYNDAITDANFSNPTRVLKPGDKFRVRAFKQIVGGSTTSEERMAFLAAQKAVHTGAQGASLVFEEKRDQLPKGYWYSSFDEKGRLWFGEGLHRVPIVYASSDGDFSFNLGFFEEVWYGLNASLCFCDVPAESSGT